MKNELRRPATPTLILAAAWAFLAAGAAGTARAQATADTSGIEEDGPGLIADHPVFRAIQPSRGYERALARGTRAADGRPGPAYWQQSVHYRIEARLDPTDARLSGVETVRYVNHAPDSLPGLLVHLYQNVFAAGVERNRSVSLTGGIELEHVAFNGRKLQALTQADLQRARQRRERPVGYRVDGTLAQVIPERMIAPGDTAELEFHWSFQVPDGSSAFRMGHIDREVYTIAQWYPQIATYDDVVGFDAKPYLGDGEFYLEYGSFDVEINVPDGWLVTATGALQNANEVLQPDAARRLEGALASEDVIQVVTADDLAAGRATATGTDGRLTWRFRAERVRDFAFATSSRYVWDATGAEVGGERGRTRIDAFYDPELEHWSDAARYSQHAVEFFSDYIMPYPYPHASAAYGPVGGMEYPMLVFIGRSRPGEPLYSVLAHEFSHEWFPMIVGSKEHAYAWMDEGLTTFNESLARQDFFGNENARMQDLQNYLRAVLFDVEAPLMEHTDYVENPFGRGVAAYQKPAMLLHTLRHVVGAETFDRAYRRYAQEWSYRHPMPWDFFATFEAEAGRDLDWFWRPWFYETLTLDQAIESVELTSDGALVTIANLRDAVMPVDLAIELEDGSSRSERWPVEVWAGTRRVTRAVVVDGSIERIRIDPERFYPDLDPSNNVWEAPTASDETGPAR